MAEIEEKRLKTSGLAYSSHNTDKKPPTACQY